MEILQYTDEHRMFRDALRRYLAKEIVPHVEEWEEAGIVPREAWKKMGEQGFLAMSVPEEYGGLGADFLYSVIVTEEMTRTNHSGLAAPLHSDIIVPYIVAFASEEALASLNAITHPAIGIEMIERQRALSDTDALVILAIPLLRPIHRETMVIDRVVVVDCPTEIAVERLITFRSFPEADARARIAAQITREERTADADFVLRNDGGLDALATQVDRLWEWIDSVRSGG